MSALSQVWLVARREFAERARTRAFRFTLLALSALLIGGIVAISILAPGDEPSPLGVGGERPEGIVADIEAVALASGQDVTVAVFDSTGQARAAVESGEVDAVLIDAGTIVSKSSPSGVAVSVLGGAAQANARRRVTQELGLSDADVTALVAPVDITLEQLEPDEPKSAEDDARSAAAFIAAVLLLTTIMMFGQFVAMGIVEEKQNRIVEVILSRISTSALLVGKVLGIGALGLVQILALGAATVIGLSVAPAPPVQGPDLASIGIVAVGWIIFWFVLGYLTYSFMYAALGATVSRQEDMQSIAFIPAFVIMPAYFLVVFSLANESGPNLWVRIASFIPIWSPIVMPVRVNVGDAAGWEIALSVAIIVVTIFGLVKLGARVYRGAALHTGGRISVREAWRSGGEAPSRP